ncbi:DUF4293 family protein [Mariniphaga sediminis]|jgi:hypothetical protein|uniref:DUF4293 family protein n=1 Tax=Mariniphaga sediminis TaxID=1628158 RepID=A0A399D5N7_9BACT|nr:DUF4293 domain-containing protein [Mariniphaga sediminis]RIH67205.1 DUF4293 family protein [Mariniphaga sediminis]
MIQRIQTIYIFLAAVLIGLLLKLNFAELAVDGNWYVFNAMGIGSGEEMIFNGLPVMGFIGLITFLHLITIFLYKKRIGQIRLLSFTIILLLGLLGIMLYFLYAGFDGAEVAFKVPMVFPLIAIILDYLAIRSIGKDEALLRSLNRIR